jgi:hypothetical protein
VHLPERELVIKIQRDQQLVSSPALARNHFRRLAILSGKIKLVLAPVPGQVIMPISYGQQIHNRFGQYRSRPTA